MNNSWFAWPVCVQFSVKLSITERMMCWRLIDNGHFCEHNNCEIALKNFREREPKTGIFENISGTGTRERERETGTHESCSRRTLKVILKNVLVSVAIEANCNTRKSIGKSYQRIDNQLSPSHAIHTITCHAVRLHHVYSSNGFILP